MRFLTPEHEDDALSVSRYGLNHLLSKVLPSFLLMRVGRTLAHCEDSIKQEYTLLSPFSQVAVYNIRACEVYPRIIMQGPVNLLERWWALSCTRDRERHAHCFVILDVRILAYDHDLEIFECGLIESIENEVFGRKANAFSVLCLHKPEQVAVRGRLQMLAQGWAPRAQ